jgi:ATP-dependent Clp protease, protease subunit
MTKKKGDDIELSAALSDLTGNPVSEELRKRGIYYITGEIESDSLLDIHQDILLKHLTPTWNDDIQLIINSVGGDTPEAWSLVDLLEWVKMDIHTTGLGNCCSMGAILLASGTPGKRVITKNTSVMVHGASLSNAGGTLQEIASSTQDMIQEYHRHLNFWKEHCNYKAEADIKNKFLNGFDHYFTPEDAMKHGIVDAIIGVRSTKKKK